MQDYVILLVKEASKWRCIKSSPHFTVFAFPSLATYEQNFINITVTSQCCLLLWRHNEHEGISNHQPLDCLLNHLYRCRSKKTSKAHVTGPCEGNPSITGGFLSQRANNTEKFLFDDIAMKMYDMYSSCSITAVHYCILCTSNRQTSLQICYPQTDVLYIES